MKLIDDIITSVTEQSEPISQSLRRCLVLAYRFKNDALKTWVESELNGYPDVTNLPDYRKSNGVAKGLFLGGWGSELRDQPIVASVLKPEHRHFATDINLGQPIAAYEGSTNDTNAVIWWPADLVAMYQTKFFQGMALNRAWMEIPASMMTGLVDTVRTRILTFALEIQAELPDEGEQAVETIPPALVDRIINVTIYGSGNVVGDVAQLNSQTIIAGDLPSLKTALRTIGVTDAEFIELERSMEEDRTKPIAANGEKTMGKKTSEWISKTAKKAGGAGLKIGGELFEEAIKMAVRKYFGMV